MKINLRNPEIIDFFKNLEEGSEFYTVAITRSMEPTIKVDESVFIRKIQFDKLNNGDIIVFIKSNYYFPIVHRIVKKIVHNNVIKFRTKGDNARTTDKWHVEEKEYIGKVLNGSEKYGGSLFAEKLSRILSLKKLLAKNYRFIPPLLKTLVSRKNE